MNNLQGREAVRALDIIHTAFVNDRFLRYRQLAVELGRDPKTNSRAVAQICDLLDAAAGYAGVPLLALVRVHNVEGSINPMAWRNGEPEWVRDAVISRSLAHRFSDADFVAIGLALVALEGLGNRAAWRKVASRFKSRDEFWQSISALGNAGNDAIDDLPGSDVPISESVTGKRFRRDEEVRQRVLFRANGRCEFCDGKGFTRSTDGTPYLETHHIIQLASDGADRESNVIALCANHHREAHSGNLGAALEQQFITIVAAKLATRQGLGPSNRS